ncbi:nucleotidyltransferase [Amycolatopsis sp.]|uniref:nucleotidyltransferase domain-containing protein n=1 Tax=Amycolatopsis sp. TaxID=37632 RepID=UPI002617A8D2|nr:nucleotidyltransferase [Amycolatopsis sp.]
MTTLEEKLAGWTGISSPTEQDKQDRTERMIREAIEAHAAFEGYDIEVYVKGSYANKTNVRADSDVDVAVKCNELMYYEEQEPGVKPAGTPYTGIWTPSYLRSELKKALVAKFDDQVDDSGSTAFKINSSTARVDADVVPCFNYRYYFASGGHLSGARVFKNDGSSLENYSQQQLDKGNAKDGRTNSDYKKVVRIMKRVENLMVENDVHRAVPSFFMECLVYNCPDEIFRRSTWTDAVKGVISHVWDNLDGDEPTDNSERWVEANDVKYLFHSAQDWDRKDGRDFAQAAWSHLELDK